MSDNSILKFLSGLVLGGITSIAAYKLINNRKQNQETLKEKYYNEQSEDKLSPIQLKKKFIEDGYLIMRNHIGDYLKDLSNFSQSVRDKNISTMRGCLIPENCGCNFRHNKCNLFMVRKYSNQDKHKYYSLHCEGVNKLKPDNEIIKEFNNQNYKNCVNSILEYIRFITSSNGIKYVADVIFITDPYDASICKDKTCGLKWHQDMFSENDKHYLYDIAALFVLETNDVSNHELLIGYLDKINQKQDFNDIQDKVVILDSTKVKSNDTDIGYIINQNRQFLHKHSDFKYLSEKSKRDVIAIRIRYLK